MAKEKFIDKRFGTDNRALIDTCNTILEEYAGRYVLTVRQLYYQLVARDFIENTLKSYKRVAGILSDARDAGLIDWDMIEDRGREVQYPAHWQNPAQIVQAAAAQFRVDRWEGQRNYVEVMCEKDALSGILGPICRDMDVRFTANRGYSSSTAMKDAGTRIRYARLAGKKVFVMYFGDHDPSGIDMTRDIRERLALYARTQAASIMRLALNMNQVEEWQPPENPAKQTDSRFEMYFAEFGESSWELDAVDPDTLAGLARDAIQNLIDDEQWEIIQARERAHRRDLNSFAAEWMARSGETDPDESDDDEEDEDDNE